jgi:hypothetical protein
MSLLWMTWLLKNPWKGSTEGGIPEPVSLRGRWLTFVAVSSRGADSPFLSTLQSG